MNKTYLPKKEDIDRKWYIVNAKGKTLGRLASRVAIILMGKNKPIYTPHLDTGDGVIVINASRIRVTGRKNEQKIYRRHSGYPGGFREVPFKIMLSNKPAKVIELAVKRMLPQGPIGRLMLKKLRVYSDDNHPHKDQNPITLEV